MSDGTSPATKTATGPTQTVREGDQWRTHRGVALAVAFVLRAVPVLAAAAASITTGRLLHRPAGLLGLGWWILLVAVAQVTLRLVERLAQRIVPLSSLLGMSLVFPDKAPSRFAVALRMGNVEKLHKDVERAVAEGLPTDLDEAVLVALSMVRLVSEHDRGTRGHSERVRAYAELIGEEMGLSKHERDRLRWGALLHDVGKLAVPSEILNKPGRPTDDEWKVLQGHPAEGTRIIEPLRSWLGDATHAVDQHHERWDGKGYPLGLHGEQIALPARIVAVADAFAVMTAARAYKKPLPIELARREITRGAGTQFDPDVARALLRASLGRINRAAGPLAALANLPFVGTIVSGAGQMPAALASGAVAASATAAAVVAPQLALPTDWVTSVTTATTVAEAPAAADGSSGSALPALGPGGDPVPLATLATTPPTSTTPGPTHATATGASDPETGSTGDGEPTVATSAPAAPTPAGTPVPTVAALPSGSLAAAGGAKTATTGAAGTTGTTLAPSTTVAGSNNGNGNANGKTTTTTATDLTTIATTAAPTDLTTIATTAAPTGNGNGNGNGGPNPTSNAGGNGKGGGKVR